MSTPDGLDTQKRLVAALSAIEDPELGVDIMSLGLVRVAELRGDTLNIRMTLTSPACPVGPWLQSQVREAAQSVLPEHTIHVEIEHDPPWSPREMNEEARKTLGYR